MDFKFTDDQLSIQAEPIAPGKSDAVVAVGDLVAVLPLAGLVDLDAERARIGKELASAQGELARLTQQLGNANFVERAPAKLVGDHRARLALVEEQVSILTKREAELAEVG